LASELRGLSALLFVLGVLGVLLMLGGDQLILGLLSARQCP
jgi:hypothetical protein